MGVFRLAHLHPVLRAGRFARKADTADPCTFALVSNEMVPDNSHP